MDAKFWHQRWEKNDIGFHQPEANPSLVKNFETLNLAKGSRVFLPLCGKTRDLSWLLSNGYQVVGVELSKIAVHQLFSELEIEPEISSSSEVIHYRANDIDIFVGDIFNVSDKRLGSVDAIYDRAALVALPADTRKQYTTHLLNITDRAPQLLICYEYDQQLMDGPPFSVGLEEVKQHYAQSYDITCLERKRLPGQLKGQVWATQTVWLLQN